MTPSAAGAVKSHGIRVHEAELIALRIDARRLRLDLSRRAQSVLAGQHRSKFRGRGMDYIESRHYLPGDDVKYIDWRVTARVGLPHTKVFIEERERPVFLLIDFSRSLFFATRGCFKSVIAARAAALIAWTVVQNGDRLGGVICSEGQRHRIKPRAGRAATLRLIHLLAQATWADFAHTHASALHRGLAFLKGVVHPGSQIFIFSDFIEVSESVTQQLSSLTAHNDLTLINLVDPIEKKFPRRGRFAIVNPLDADDSAELRLAGGKVAAAVQEIFSERDQRILKLTRDLGVGYIELATDQSPEAQLRNLLGVTRAARSSAAK